MVSRFANCTVAHKLILGFGLVFLLMVSILSIDVFNNLHQETLTQNLVGRLYPAQRTIAQIETLVQTIDDSGAWYILERVAIPETSGRSKSSPQQSSETLKSYYQQVAKLHTLIATAQSLALSSTQHRAIQDFTTAYFGRSGYYEGNEAVFRLKRAGHTQQAYQAYIKVLFAPSLVFVHHYQQESEQTIAQVVKDEHTYAQLTIISNILLGILALCIGTTTAFLIVRSITIPLKQVQSALQQVSSADMASLTQGLRALAYGDLTQPVESSSASPDYESQDEIGEMAQAVRMIIADIRRIITSYERARQELQRLYRKLQTKNNALLEANERLQALAVTDPLTSLGNHRSYQEALHQALEQAYNSGEVVMLALLDMDEFKILNEEYGHRYGDQLLSAIAELLREFHFSKGTAFRLSGDTFAVLVPASEQEHFSLLAEEMRLEAHKKLGGVTISMGVATSVVGARQTEMLQEHAYAALHEAKRRGRDVIVRFETIRSSVKLLSLQKIHALRNLLSDGKIAIAFQPIWDLEKGSVLAFEALARPDPAYGFAGPADAFELAEQLGRGFDLDALCIQAVLTRVDQLPSDVFLFMNITPQTFNHDRFQADKLKDLVVCSGFPPERVVIEITERASIPLEVLLETVQQLRLQGFLLALDDTGVGNAGLEMLHRVSFDFVKVDRAVIVDAMTQRSARGVLNGICAIARESNSYVIVEGIEDKSMLDLAYQLEVRAAQGYLLGRPSEQIPPPAILAQCNPRVLLDKLVTP